MEDIGVTVKEKLTSKKDRFTQLTSLLKNEGFEVELICEDDFTSITFNTSNPDPIEISIQLFKDYFKSKIKNIEIIHSLIWLSLSGYVKDDIDSILASFYNGIYWMNRALD